MDILTIALGVVSIIVFFVSILSNGVVAVLGMLIGAIGFTCGYMGRKNLKEGDEGKVYRGGMILSAIGISLSFVVIAVFVANLSNSAIERVTGLYNSVVNP